MNCMNCGSNHDVIDFLAGDEKLILCVDCRYKLAKGELGKVGRPTIGLTKKVSLTLPKEDWEWLDEKAEGNRSQFLRETVTSYLGNEAEWSNRAALGYAVLAAKELNYNHDDIKKLISAIYYQFDMKTVDEAEKIYGEIDY